MIHKRFIEVTTTTKNGEVAEETYYTISEDRINEEKKYDGYYAVCTNLEDDALEIIKVNHRRWEIEESFRIMKSEFEARPVYLKRQDRIKAHFMICFLALMVAMVSAVGVSGCGEIQESDSKTVKEKDDDDKDDDDDDDDD